MLAWLHTCRLHLELKPAGAVHVLPDPVAAGTCDSSSTQHQLAVSTTSGDSSSQGPHAGSRPATGCPGLDGFQPQWLLLSESNDWRKRVQVAQRFVQAARVVIYRNRAQARIKKLRGLAGMASNMPGVLTAKAVLSHALQYSALRETTLAVFNTSCRNE
jgi:hypothetical protein